MKTPIRRSRLANKLIPAELKRLTNCRPYATLKTSKLCVVVHKKNRLIEHARFSRCYVTDSFHYFCAFAQITNIIKDTTKKKNTKYVKNAFRQKIYCEM